MTYSKRQISVTLNYIIDRIFVTFFGTKSEDSELMRIWYDLDFKDLCKERQHKSENITFSEGDPFFLR